MKRIESLLKIADMKFEFYNLEIHFHKRQVSFLVVVLCVNAASVNNSWLPDTNQTPLQTLLYFTSFLNW